MDREWCYSNNFSVFWREDEQTEFIAKDTMGIGEYQISLDIRDDLSKVTVIVTSSKGVDLAPWGGITDGKIVAEYSAE